MILFLHNTYRTTGGEERAVGDLMWLVREHLGEDAERLERDSALVGRSAAAAGLLGGGLRPEEVARAVRRTGARLIHAHNLHPTFGWRALAAARDAGARVVLHLHQYRLVCAVGTCFTEGQDCTRCHGVRTLPGVRHNCRGSHAESLTYAAALSMWQRRLTGLVDAFVVPSAFALSRLGELGAGIDPARTHVVPNVVRSNFERAAPDPAGPAMLAARLAPEKGVEVALTACRLAGMKLIVAGEGPERARLEAAAAAGGGAVSFTGQLDGERLMELRRSAALALVPSLFAETFGLAAAESMAAGLPVAGSRIGALTELLPEDWQAPPGQPEALAAVMLRFRTQPDAGERGRLRVQEMCSAQAVAPRLRAVYASADAGR